MALETGTYISDLNANNPVTATDIVREGSDHLRLVKSTILNTFPNITGAMTKTHTQLNNAPDASVSSLFSVTDPTDLVDTDNALNIGTLAGAHLALDPNTLQAKASETAVAALHLNRLGGVVNLGGNARTSTTGLDLAPDTSNAKLSLYNAAYAAEQARISFNEGSNLLYVRAEVNSAHIQLRSLNSVGSATVLAEGDPDGEFSIDYAGVPKVRTLADGAKVENTGASAQLIVETGAASLDAYLRLLGNTNGGFGLQWDESTQQAKLRFQTAAGANDDVFMQATLNGELEFFHNNTSVFKSRTTGIEVGTGAAANLYFNRDGLNYIDLSGGTAAQLRVRNSANASIFNIDADGGTSLYYNAVRAILTQDHTVADQSTAALIKHANGSEYDMGMNVSPHQNRSANFTLNRDMAGLTQFVTGGGATINSTTNDAPDGAMWILINWKGSALTIAAAVGVTLNWADGAGGSLGGSGVNRTLADGGICTIQKRGDNSYMVWGVGLS